MPIPARNAGQYAPPEKAGQSHKSCNCAATLVVAEPFTRGVLKRAHIIAGEFRYIGKETDRKWEEGEEISILEFKATEYGRSKKVIASEEIKKQITEIGINRCGRESGFDRKNFIRKLIRGIPVKRNSYNEFVRWIQSYESQKCTQEWVNE